VRRLALALAVLAGTGIVPALAQAVVVPGPNGPLVFTSGRDDGATTLSDSVAQIWFLSGPGGSALRLSGDIASHHRHASWSPDRTKIAYARGANFAGPWDIYVQDLTTPPSATNPIQITNTPSLREDRPSWSPDGSRLAYAKESAPGFWDIVTKSAAGTGAETQVADTASAGPGNSGQFSRPQWSPDGQTIFYSKVISAAMGPPLVLDYDIYRAPADGSQHIIGGTPVVAGPTHDYQPALAPDGDNLCFTRQGTTKDIAVAPPTGGAGTVLIAESGDEYECAWSPDDSNIAFVRGGFGAGEIRVKNLESNALSSLVTDVPGRFDGNPDWTYNPRPTCSNGSASVPFNGFVQIQLSCADIPDPPSFQQNSPDPEIATPPSHGVLGGINDGKVIYTPNVNFQGTDTFTYTGSDQKTTSAPATINITVGGPGSGPDVTAPRITRVSVFPRRWRRGRQLPHFSARTGTRIRWRLSEPARVRVTFQRKRGRRFVSVRPSLLRRNAKAGLNTLRFQGRMNRRRLLALGSYRAVIRAVDAAGNRAKSKRSRTFTIVAR